MNLNAALVTIILTAAAVGWFAPRAALGQEVTPIAWKTGPQLRQALEQESGIAWQDTILREGISRLATTQQVAILLDRRIDPSLSLTVTLQNLPLQSVLDEIAKRASAEKSVVGSVTYLGPPDDARRLATVAALKRRDAQLLPADTKSRWLKSSPVEWPRLSRPRDLATVLVATAGAQLLNPEQIPHDVWPATSLPALPLVDQLSLLLVQLDLQLDISRDGKLARVTSLPAAPSYDYTYAAKGRGKKLATDLERMFPEAQVTPTEDEVRVVARFEDHEQINRLVRGEQVRRTEVRTGEKRYTLTVENQPAGAVAKTIATQLKLTLLYDAAVGEQLKKSVSFQVKEVSLEELLKETLGPLSLTYRQTDTALEILQEMP